VTKKVHGPSPLHPQPVQGYIAGNCKSGKHKYCFTLKCTCPCHKAAA